MGLETGAALLLSSALGAGASAVQAHQGKVAAKRRQREEMKQAADQRAIAFQDQERERKAAQGRSRLEQSAVKTAQKDIIRSRGLTPTFSSLSKAVLDRTS